MNIGFYAGSFDPFTYGHLHVIRQASKVFDKVVVGIGVNPDKPDRRFDKNVMKEAMEKVFVTEGLSNKVEVVVYDGLSIDAAINSNAGFFIRGIRNGIDYNEEENLAGINEEVAGIDTIYFRSGVLGNISSSMVMMLLKNGKNVDKFLPKEILEVVK